MSTYDPRDTVHGHQLTARPGTAEEAAVCGDCGRGVTCGYRGVPESI